MATNVPENTGGCCDYKRLIIRGNLEMRVPGDDEAVSGFCYF